MRLFSIRKHKKNKANDGVPLKLSEDEKKARFVRQATSHVSIEEIASKMKEILEARKANGVYETKISNETNVSNEVNGSSEVIGSLPVPEENVEDNKEVAINRRPSCVDPTKSILGFIPTPDFNDLSYYSNAMFDGSLGERRTFLGLKDSELSVKETNEGSSLGSILNGNSFLDMDPEFTSAFAPGDMRCLALVSHNNMKAAMKQFVLANKNVLKKFRLTGTNTTMSMLKEVFGDDPAVIYGPACKSGPLGGDAQLVALAVSGQCGGCIFFIDPMDSHPHSSDIECLVRQGNVHNLLMMNNPTTAHVTLQALRIALKMGRMEMFPSFFFDLESPSVPAYERRQKAILTGLMRRGSSKIQSND
mmetsp:Transcript_19268/g.27103  ORF Transcript_19268/g.27103 Transcript_19268/m.27103 type:complete len:362 (-) Transcript_19268:230-1315(-)